MKRKSFRWLLVPYGIVGALLVPELFAQQQGAATQPPAEEEQAKEPSPFVEEIVVTGTRQEGLVPTETLSPIDVLPTAAFVQQATPDLTDSMTKVAPSFSTQRFPIADGTAFIRPVTLRNLSPDHTLVLVNGTRRHRSALVNLQLAPLGTVNQGSQGVDFSTLPAAAIERIEVLRDGAAAQYGSDAIAGVVNVILKDDREGFSVLAQTGEYFDRDGARTMISANGGFGLGANGFLNASFEYSSSETTSRGQARPDAAAVAQIVGKEKVPFNGLGQRWGDPEVKIGKVFLNLGYEFSDAASFYSYASYVDNQTRSDFFYRRPVLDPQFRIRARETLQVDNNGDFRPDPAPQSLVNAIRARGLNPDDYLVRDASSPSGYVLRNPIFTLFPGGYNPNFGADITDLAGVLGFRGKTSGGLRWDVRGRFAEDKVEYQLSESINPSLGRRSPTSFRPGTLTQEESSLNVDFVKPIEVAAFAAPLNLAFGFELRQETYKIGAGDPASREVGPTAAFFGLGSDGFQGFPLESAGSFDSQSVAGYVDFETKFTDKFSGGLALRFENYDEFGSTFDWKLSGRYDVTERFAIRATGNTGFRAPTPGQVNTLNVTTTADASGNLIPSGVYPVNHPVARVLGAIPLEPEDSTAFTFGLVIRPSDRSSLTLDIYRLEIEGRLALQNNTIRAADVPRLRAAGVQNAELLVGSLANFFSNAFDSEVNGLDVAWSNFFAIGSRGLFTVDARYNFNEQEVTRVAAGTIDASRVFDLENQVPKHRATLTLNYDSGGWFSSLVRANYYGSWKSTGGLFSPGDASDVSTYGAKTLVDVELGFTIADRFRLAIGGENVFDTRPDPEGDPVLQFLGVVDSLTSPFGFNGGQWYVRLGVGL